MTHVLYMGVPDFVPQLRSIMIEDIAVQRVVFPPNRYSMYPERCKRKGEQELCFLNVHCGDQNVLLIDNNNDLWGWGCSNNGQLGRMQIQLEMPLNISQVTHQQYRCAASTNGYLVASTLSNKIQIWGSHEFQGGTQLNYDEHIEREYKLHIQDFTFLGMKKIGERRSSQLQLEIHAMDCSGNKCYLLSQQKVYHMGHLPIHMSFAGIACSESHTIAWDYEGLVWTWGECTDGKLGYMNQDNIQSEPRQGVHFDNKIIMCAAGHNYSMALDVRGDLYTWGKGPFKVELIKAIEPTRHPKKSPYIKICAGHSHFGALDLTGRVYLWGLNFKGCIHEMDDEVRQPQLYDLKTKVIEIGMGPFYTVLIVPSNKSYKLPQPNLERYTQHQHRRVQEESKIIRDYVFRKNNADELVSQPKIVIDEDKPETFDETLHMIRRMKTKFLKTKVDEPIKLKAQVSYQASYQYDQVSTELQKMEEHNALFVPLKAQIRLSTEQQEEINELDEILNTDNDVLKYQYIQMVQEKDENQIFMSLLDDPRRHHNHDSEGETPRQNHKMLLKSKTEIKMPKIIPFQPEALQIMRQAKAKVMQQRKIRKALEEKKAKLRDQELNQQLDLQKQLRVPIQSRDEILMSLQRQAQERDIKVMNAQHKKAENINQKHRYLVEKQEIKTQRLATSQKLRRGKL